MITGIIKNSLNYFCVNILHFHFLCCKAGKVYISLVILLTEFYSSRGATPEQPPVFTFSESSKHIVKPLSLEPIFLASQSLSVVSVYPAPIILFEFAQGQIP